MVGVEVDKEDFKNMFKVGFGIDMKVFGQFYIVVNNLVEVVSGVKNDVWDNVKDICEVEVDIRICLI